LFKNTGRPDVFSEMTLTQAMLVTGHYHANNEDPETVLPEHPELYGKRI